MCVTMPSYQLEEWPWGRQSGTTLALWAQALFVSASVFTLSVFSSCFCAISASTHRSACRIGQSRAPCSFSWPYLFSFSSDCVVSLTIAWLNVLMDYATHLSMEAYFLPHKEGGKCIFLGQYSDWALQHAPRSLHIQFPHLYLGPSKEQGDISAVLSGENSYRLLSVLDVHSIYLTEKEENKIELMLDNERPFTPRLDSVKLLSSRNSFSLERRSWKESLSLA